VIDGDKGNDDWWLRLERDWRWWIWQG